MAAVPAARPSRRGAPTPRHAPTRREVAALGGLGLLGLAGGLTGCSGSSGSSGSSGATGRPSPAGAAPSWPSQTLGPEAATTVEDAQFVAASQLRAWGVDLDRRGMRATGGPAHEAYVDELRRRLVAAGVPETRFENVPMTRWTTASWSLELVDAAGGLSAGPVATAAYVPYSGRTGPGGVTARLTHLAVGEAPDPVRHRGTIVVFDVPTAGLTQGVLAAIALRSYAPAGTIDPKAAYDRPNQLVAGIITILDRLAAVGAAGAVGVLPLSADEAHGAYYPYDRKVRDVPAVFVDRTVGARLAAVAGAAAGPRARLTLPAEVVATTTRNLIGVIPGASDEMVLLHSHTDGTNGLEDNGPDAIVAMAQYLRRIPRASLPRTVLILLATGHFDGGLGTETFIRQHRADLVPKIAAAITLEHLGALDWEPGAGGRLTPTGRPETGLVFASPITPLLDAAATALRRADAAPGFVLGPLAPNASGGVNDAVWPGEGQNLWAIGRVPTANYITGPTYLLNWGVDTAARIDFDRARRLAIAFTEMALDLSRMPFADLHRVN